MTKFFAMALTALTIASCSKEHIGNGDDNGGGSEINTPTYATFKFNTNGVGSRAVIEFEPTTQAANDVVDAKIGRLQLLIFNAGTQALEHNSILDPKASSKTVLLTAGKKKIFVIANNNKLDDYNAAIAPDTFTPDSPTSTLNVFNGLVFNAGTPQSCTVDKTGGRTFSFEPLYTWSNKTTGNETGLPMSNTNEVTYLLNAGVTESDAASGTSVPGGVSPTNTFTIQLYYMTAKARLVLAANVLSAGDDVKPVIKDVMYSIRNLARVTNYVQNVPTAGSPQSYYYSFAGKDQAAFDKEFDYASNISVPVNETAGNYLYVPENNHLTMLLGQASYFGVKATFEPVVISAVAYDLSTKVRYTMAKLAAADATNRNYIYTTSDVEGIPAGTYFLNVALLEEAAWIMKYNRPFVEADNRAEAKALVADPTSTNPTVGGAYMSFTNASSYYRIDIGAGSGPETIYGVLRSNKYDATVNKITGPGVPSEEDLTVTPGNPVSAKTYISATIIPASWSPVTQSADLY